jgi:hypothetical protein
VTGREGGKMEFVFSLTTWTWLIYIIIFLVMAGLYMSSKRDTIHDSSEYYLVMGLLNLLDEYRERKERKPKSKTTAMMCMNVGRVRQLEKVIEDLDKLLQEFYNEKRKAYKGHVTEYHNSMSLYRRKDKSLEED